MRDDPQVQQAAAAWQLALTSTTIRGGVGDLRSRRAGSSLEFHEYRQYLPGDDLRKLDWSAYARTDQWMIRLHREEVSPRTDIVLDASRSMSAGDGSKWRVARQLAALLTLLAEQMGEQPRLHLLDDQRPPRVINGRSLSQLTGLSCDGRQTLAEAIAMRAIPWHSRGLRIVISDFLFPADPGRLLQRLADGAGLLWLIQTVTRDELDPAVTGGRRLVDLESHEQLDLVITPAALDRYRERLSRLREGLDHAARGAGAVLLTATVDDGLESICRDTLFRSRLLQPA